MTSCPAACEKEANANYSGDACTLLMSAYILAGLAMMLNIRLSYSSAPYALIRFRLPENLFSVFVRRMASALELWCLPSMLLGNIIDLAHKLIGEKPELRAIMKKATDIQGAAETLKTTAGTGVVDTVGTLAEQLATKAGQLNRDATAITGAGLEELQPLAQELATAAKGTGGSDDTSLHKKAESLQGAQTDHAKAIEVIDAFKMVKEAFEKLAKEKIYQEKLAAAQRQSSVLGSEQQKVQTVDRAWTQVNSDFENLCKALFKQYATEVESKANALQGNANVENAKQFKEKYDKFKEIYNSIPEGSSAKSTVTSNWNALKDVISGEMKWWKFIWIIAPSIVSQWLNFLTYVMLLAVYLMGGDTGHLTIFYLVIAISGFVFGINMTLVYSVDFYYIPVYIVGENTFPALTSFIHYLATLMFGNRRKWNSDYLLVKIDIWVAIVISFVAAVVWTYGYLCEIKEGYENMKHIHANEFGGTPDGYQISPFLMIVVGMGLVYAIYPGIAPGMIVPFYLIDKIEMVLLIATIFPPVIIAILRLKAPAWSPQHNLGGYWGKWKTYDKPKWEGGGKVQGWIWHLFDLLMVTKISLAAIFIYCLHYRDSHLSRSIVNQPKMSTALSITFYMCHEILLAVGFSGFIGNDGGDYILIPQYIGALFMIFLAFYSEGYIIEYKSHDHAHWPTTGMIKWNALCYWTKSK